YRQTAISWAAERGHLDVVNALYKKGADIDNRDKYDRTLPYWACSNGKQDVIDYFLSNEQNASHKYYNGRNLLFVATGYGSLDDVKRFLKSDPNPCDDKRMTPFMFAVQKSHVGNVEALRDAGAKPLLKDNAKRSALHYAVESHLSAAIIGRLISVGCDVNARDSGGK
ncbi:ankyrin repeat-containing domain protein, partial [Triangularia setosa]